MADGDYVLGTRDDEIERLGLQHQVWRERTLGAWRRGGLLPGMHALDVGAGPGFATRDLADLVGREGRVTAVERSPRFAAHARAESARLGLSWVEVVEGDLMSLAPAITADFAWCRWVASFVGDVGRLAAWLAASVRPGGRLVMHEYADYASWRWAPARPMLAAFVAEVMASWRASGGEPDVAPALVEALHAHGFAVAHVRPHVFTTTPAELTWRWPASFVAVNCARLVELGRVDGAWSEGVLAELREAESDPRSVMMTPAVWEIVARRE